MKVNGLNIELSDATPCTCMVTLTVPLPKLGTVAVQVVGEEQFVAVAGWLPKYAVLCPTWNVPTPPINLLKMVTVLPDAPLVGVVPFGDAITGWKLNVA